jgi:hypothetical protein
MQQRCTLCNPHHQKWVYIPARRVVQTSQTHPSSLLSLWTGQCHSTVRQIYENVGVLGNKAIDKNEVILKEIKLLFSSILFIYFFGGLECVGHSFAYVAHCVLLRDVWIRTRRPAI